ncbi:hypothetical protein COLSTE_01868 [Collinsella stercoris DSM 13279]|uniref:Uncharacterized protein n=1 Tax=Collinsella stercoris DSM 13279 TaxID=445975 RepID=B6GCP5_9ACTN|nr:hypothetical protein COLSTE_01868 [Collinsella stercoris DSM 13279]
MSLLRLSAADEVGSRTPPMALYTSGGIVARRHCYNGCRCKTSKGLPIPARRGRHDDGASRPIAMAAEPYGPLK